MWIYLFYNLDDVMAQIFWEAKKKYPKKQQKQAIKPISGAAFWKISDMYVWAIA